jgi:ribosomal protein S18 acetylase RimI-like enzyme
VERYPQFIMKYLTDLKEIEATQLTGFFVGWPNPPTEETFLKLLNGSYRVILALDKNKVVGFINSVSDGVLSAYIPLLEVLPEYQSQRIGQELVKRMKIELGHLYMIDVLCDEELIPYYEKQGMTKASGAILRNYDNQNGLP